MAKRSRVARTVRKILAEQPLLKLREMSSTEIEHGELSPGLIGLVPLIHGKGGIFLRDGTRGLVATVVEDVGDYEGIMLEIVRLRMFCESKPARKIFAHNFERR